MSRYENVITLLNVADSNNQESLVNLMERGYANSSYEALAEDIAFVIISLWAMVPTAQKLQFQDRLTDDIVNFEISLMFDSEEEE